MSKKSISILILMMAFTLFLSSEPVNISLSPSTPSLYAAVATYGNKVMVVWREEGSLWDIYYTLYSDGKWSSPGPAYATPQKSKNGHVAVGPDGAFHVTWVEGGTNANMEIYYGMYKNGAWQPLEHAFNHPNDEDAWPRVAVMGNNMVNLTWDYEVTGRYDKITKNTWKPVGGSWNAAGLTVSKKLASHYVGHSDICTLGNKIFCVWREGADGAGFNIKFAQKEGTGSWTTPVYVNNPVGGVNSYPRVAVDSNGTVHALWENGQNVKYAKKVGSSAWTTAVRINKINCKHPNFVDIDVDAQNNIHAVYTGFTSTTQHTFYNFKTSTGNWDPTKEIQVSTENTPNQMPAIAVDSSGAAHIAWSSDTVAVPCDIMYAKVTGFGKSITVTSPVGGEKWITGNTIPIRWTTTGITGNVDLKIVNGQTGTAYDIAAVAYNSSPYNYVIPPEIPAGYYLIRIKQTPVNGSSQIFGIIDITITSDHTGKTYGIGSYIPISWTTSAITGDITVNLIKSDSSATYPLGTVPFNGSPHNFPIPAGIATGAYYIRMKHTPENERTADFNLVNPSITVTTPTAGANYNVEGNLPVAWTTTAIEGNLTLTLWKSGNSASYPIAVVARTASPYNYTIPCAVAPGQYYVKINQGTTAANSANFNILASANSITVTYPNGGEVERAGTVQTVTWNSTGAIANVRIEFSPDNGANWGTLVPTAPNTGSYTGLVPTDSPTSTTCLLRISDAAGCAQDVSDGVFTILPALPIYVFSPVGGETFSRGNQIPIGWTTSGITGDITINLVRSDQSLTYTVGVYPHDTLGIYYTIPTNVTPGTYFIRVKQNPYNAKSNNFTIN